MAFPRAGLRVIALALLTLGVFGSWLVTRLLRPVWPRGAARSHHWLLRSWARGVAAVLGLEIDVRGEPPKAPFLLVSNHVSYVDVVVLMSCADCVLLSKAEVRRWPAIGFMAKTTGTLFVDRRVKADLPRVIGEVERTLASGSGVVMFPEGTSTRGDEVLRFHSSLFEVAERTGTPVRCAAVTYSTGLGTSPAHEWVCWHGDATFTDHAFRLLKLASFRATVTFGDEVLEPAPRKELAQRAHEVVASLFTPVTL